MVEDGEYRGDSNSHITKRNHANRLPHSQPNTGGDTTVQTLDTVGRVDVLERVAHGHLLGAVGVFLLALHLHPDHLNGLVPRRQATTQTAGKDLLQSAKLLALGLACDIADALLSQTRQTEAAAPVGHLADGYSVDTLVDAGNTLLAVDVGKGGPGGRGLDAAGSNLVLGDFNRLHASAEAHGGVGLGHTARHTARDAADELGGACVARVELGLRGHEEEHGTLGGGLDPGPGNQTLVDCGEKGHVSE